MGPTRVEGLSKLLDFPTNIRLVLKCLSATVYAGNTKGGSITVPLTSCLTGLDLTVLQIKTKIVSCHATDSKPVKQEINGRVIHPLFSIPWFMFFKVEMTKEKVLL